MTTTGSYAVPSARRAAGAAPGRHPRRPAGFALLLAALGAGALWPLTVTPARAATTITVTTTGDTIANDTSCTLREAVIAANSGIAANGCSFSGSGAPYTIVLSAAARTP